MEDFPFYIVIFQISDKNNEEKFLSKIKEFSPKVCNLTATALVIKVPKTTTKYLYDSLEKFFNQTKKDKLVITQLSRHYQSLDSDIHFYSIEDD